MLYFTRKNSLKYYIFGLFFLILVGGILFYLAYDFPKEAGNENINVREVNLTAEKNLVFITHYVVGNNKIEKKVESFESVEAIQNSFPDWKITSIKNDEVILEKYIEDLAPDLKSGAYFSLNENGYLTLFQMNSGEQKQKVVETFYRIDIEKLESLLPKEPIDQLYQGIPIQDLAEYNSVISTFSEFSAN